MVSWTKQANELIELIDESNRLEQRLAAEREAEDMVYVRRSLGVSDEEEDRVRATPGGRRGP